MTGNESGTRGQSRTADSRIIPGRCSGDVPARDDIGDLPEAIAEFKAALPGWWFSVGSCSISRDASCGPDLAHCDRDTLNAFDEGFHHDDKEPGSTMAGSLRVVTAAAVEALRERAA